MPLVDRQQIVTRQCFKTNARDTTIVSVQVEASPNDS